MTGPSLFQVGDNVEFWRVLTYLTILVTILRVFGSALHYVERYLARYDKYYHMLQKVYKELMIFGLISLVMKLLMEVAPINSFSKPMIAFQVADLALLGFAIALVLQATCIFLQVGNYSRRAYRAELFTTQDLLTDLDRQKSDMNGSWTPRNVFFSIYRTNPVRYTPTNKDVVAYRILRHYFLRRFGLPQLFPFFKYIRRAQANQISHMIEVAPTMWLLILAVAWGICGLSTALEEIKLVKLLVILAWSLVLCHCLLLLYLRSCKQQLLGIAGYSDNNHELYSSLARIAEDEINAWESETAESAINTMSKVHELHEEIERESKTARQGRAQFVVSCCNQLCKSKKMLHNLHCDLPPSAKVDLRYFSSKFWHRVVMVLLTLNGFFTALFVQCALYNIGEIYSGFGLITAITVPLPMLLNTLVLQQFIFRDFTLVCSILELDVQTLGNVTKYFIETVELQSQFAASVLQCLRDGGLTIASFETFIRSHDLTSSGLVEIDTLRSILASVGLSFTPLRFNSLINLLFDLKGASVEYVQLFQLLVLVQHDNERCDRQSRCRKSEWYEDHTGSSSYRLSSHQPIALLARSSLASDRRYSDFGFRNIVSPTLHRISALTQQPTSKNANLMRKFMIKRRHSSRSTDSSSKVLHYMYNIPKLLHFRKDSAAAMV